MVLAANVTVYNLETKTKVNMSDDGSQAEAPKEIPPPPAGKKIFLSHCNSYEGQAMFKELCNKDKIDGLLEEHPDWGYAAHTFTGTIRKEEKNARGGFEEPPEGVQEFVDFERTESFRQKLLESDVIIYDLLSNNFEEVDYVIKTLKTSDLQTEKTLVLLSSVMTWVNTPPKMEEDKAEGDDDEGDGGEAPADEPSEDEPVSEEEEEKKDDGEGSEAEPELDDNGEPIVITEPKDFKETDYHLRVPHQDYNQCKTLETTAMSAVNTQPKLRVHVMCSGIRYGNGERTFYDHFQKAWIQNPVQLPIIGEGNNLVPTIHVIDLARLVRRVVIENPQVKPYIFAIDKTRKPTAKRTIIEIAKGLGTGQIASCSFDDVTDEQRWRQKLTINLRMKASDAFKAMPLTEEQQEGLEPEEIEKLQEEAKFPWHSKYGIRKNIKKLEGEFNKFRGLNPVKIFVTGPPASGKTFYSEKLATYYNIPRVYVNQLVDEFFRRAAIEEEDAGEDVLTNACRTKMEAEKERLTQIILDSREGLDEPEEGWPEPEISNEDVRGKDDLLWADDLLWEILKLKLRENDCRNRGYILDGFPRQFKGAQNVFLKKIQQFDENGDPIDDDEVDPDDENYEGPPFDDAKKFEVDMDVFPGSVVVLNGEDDDLIDRVRELPEDQIAGTQYNFEDMQRRLKAYRVWNNSLVAEPAVQDFFKQKGIAFYNENMQTRVKDALNGLKIYIERVSPTN